MGATGSGVSNRKTAAATASAWPPMAMLRRMKSRRRLAEVSGNESMEIRAKGDFIR
jgi:hypothetical protein